MQRPLCFVLMPFGEKTDISGRKINFDAIYRELIQPAIEKVGLESIRADEEKAGGIIHKAMFERLILCEFAVADLTTANANVFYELGVRHAVRPYRTALIFAGDTRLPFDVGCLRALPYQLNSDGILIDKEGDLEKLVKNLSDIKSSRFTDSPLYQLFDELKPQSLSHEKTDAFRDQVKYSQTIKKQLKEAREKGIDALKEIEQQLTPLDNIESGILIDLLLHYRDKKAWKEMIQLIEKLPKPLRERVLLQEQLGFALNRAGQNAEAEEVLLNAIRNYGPSSETYGLLGRVYKDRWEEAAKSGNNTTLINALLEKAIDTYVNGFQADMRDAYPGINALTLMESKTPPDPRQSKLLPVVIYAVEQKIAKGTPDYWDFATLLELAILGSKKDDADLYLGKALIEIRAKWEPETTARNLRLIRKAREKRGIDTGWIKKIEQQLLS